jgi:hypothetical protein
VYVTNTNGVREQPLSDETVGLLDIYLSLDLKRRIKLLDLAFALEEEKTKTAEKDVKDKDV